MEHLGIKVKSMTEEEYCLIPMGGVLPKFPQRTLGIGGTGGMVHPSTGKALTLLFCHMTIVMCTRWTTACRSLKCGTWLQMIAD